MYDVFVDPYCYEGSTVLQNIPDLRDQAALDTFEAVSTTQRADEPLPTGRFSTTHYRAIHHHLFQDVYSWAGKFRTVRMTKDESTFCYPEHIAREMTHLFDGLKARQFLKNLIVEQFATEAAHFLATLNAIHPFREGNGRTQMSFLSLLASKTGHPIAHDRINPAGFLAAMVASFQGDERMLHDELARLVQR